MKIGRFENLSILICCSFLLFYPGCDLGPPDPNEDDSDQCNAPSAQTGHDVSVVDENEDGFETLLLVASESSGEIVSYQWSEHETVLYEGGESETSLDFEVGYHPLTLTVTSDCGATDSAAMYVHVKPLPECAVPVASGLNISQRDADGDGAETVELDGSGSSSDVAEFEWSANDVLLGVGPTLSHGFAVGMHVVTLAVANECGNTDTDEIVVNIISESECGPVTADAGESVSQTDTDSDGQETVVLNASNSTGNIAAYMWTEGDEVLYDGPEETFAYEFTSGVHMLVLTATDVCGNQDKDAVYIEVFSEDCVPPEADAGQNIVLEDSDNDGFETVELNGIGSSGDIVAYIWSVGETVIGNERTVAHSFTTGLHMVTLKVANACGAMDLDAVYVEIRSVSQACNPPVANAGENVSLADTDLEGFGVEPVTINAFESGDIERYEWLNDNGGIMSTGPVLVYNFQIGIHLITLRVVNNCGAVDRDLIYVEITENPVVCNPLNAILTAVPDTYQDAEGDGEPVHLDGSGSTGDIVLYEWEIDGVPSGSGANMDTLDHTFPIGCHLVVLRTTDDCGYTATDAVRVKVEDARQPPDCQVPPESIINGPDYVLLREGDAWTPDGSASIGNTYRWYENGADIGSQPILPPRTFPVGEYVITLEVTSEYCPADSDMVYVRVLPVCGLLRANIANQSIFITDMDGDGYEWIDLDGTGSTGNISTYEWSEGGIPLTSVSAPTLGYNFPVGEHVITLKVIDPACPDMDMDAVYIRVYPRPSVCVDPTARVTISPPGTNTPIDTDGNGFETISLSGLGSTGTNLNYEWWVDGNRQSYSSTFSHDFPVGEHSVVLIVWDNCGIRDLAAMCIRVTEPPPVCNPLNAVITPAISQSLADSDGNGYETVQLSATDSAGDIMSYEWVEEGVFRRNGPTLNHNFPVGEHIVLLRVYDMCGDVDTDAVYIRVVGFGVGGNPPVANAGPDQSIYMTEPVPNLDGSMSYDPDGDPLFYHWYVTDDATAIPNPNSAITLPDLGNPMMPGVYYFILIVNDGTLCSEPDVVKITVIAPNAMVDSTFTGEWTDPPIFRTIQAAINYVRDNVASTPKIITVTNGPYNESIDVYDDIQLYGVDLPYPRIYAGETFSVVNLFDNTTIANFDIQCTGLSENVDPSRVSAIRVYEYESYAINVTISDCNIYNSSSDGIRVVRRSSVSISGVVIDNVQGEGIQAGTGSDVFIENTTIMNTWGSAIWLSDAARADISNVCIYNAGYHGIDSLNCGNTRIDHCTIVDFTPNAPDGQSGIFVNNTTSMGQTVITNTIVEIADIATLCGIYYEGPTDPATLTLENNYVYSKQSSEPRYYCGDISIDTVGATNRPNPPTTDPLIRDPANGDCCLLPGSPTAGLGRMCD